MLASAKIGNLTCTLPKADLQNQVIKLSSFTFESSEISFEDYSVATTAEEPVYPITSSLVWPDWEVEIEEMTFKNNSFLYKTDTIPPIENYLNTNYMQVTGFGFEMKDMKYLSNELTLDMDGLFFKEFGGFALKECQFHLDASPKSAEFTNFRLATNISELNGDFTLYYPAIDMLYLDPMQLGIDMRMHDVALDLSEIYYLYPEYAEEAYFKTLSQRKWTGIVSMKAMQTTSISEKWI
jgi:translocation and assembly module TamB